MDILVHGGHLIKECLRAQNLDHCSSNFFINDIFLFIQEGSLCNFADDNTISISAVNADELHRLVQHNTNKCIDWFNSNHMTANPSKFQSLIVGNNDNHITEFSINDEQLKFGFKINVSSEIVTLLGIQIDEQLKFDLHIDKVCKKAAIQLILTQSKD